MDGNMKFIDNVTMTEKRCPGCATPPRLFRPQVSIKVARDLFVGQRLRVTPLAQHLFDLGDVQFLVADHLTGQLFERHAATLGQSE
jgi:hypothetical protein